MWFGLYISMRHKLAPRPTFICTYFSLFCMKFCAWKEFTPYFRVVWSANKELWVASKRLESIGVWTFISNLTTYLFSYLNMGHMRGIRWLMWSDFGCPKGEECAWKIKRERARHMDAWREVRWLLSLLSYQQPKVVC